MRRFTVDDWQQRLNQINQPLLIIGKRKEDKKEVFTLQCYKCGGIFDATRKSLYSACTSREKHGDKANWCPICNGKQVVKGINDIATLRNDLVKYFKNPKDAESISTGSFRNVKLKCPECKQVKSIHACDLCTYGFHCDYCNDNVSLGEKIVRNLILQLPIKEYDFEFTDTWTQNKRYDCFFKYMDKKYLIEVDGEQHTKNTSWSTKEWQSKNDEFKTALAKENGFELIRIKAYRTDFEFIKQSVLESRLSEIFDLSQIDWNKICKQTVTSNNLLIAQYYMEHQDMMLKDIAKHFHVSPPTITHTLKKMAQIGMCNYSKEKAFKNGRVQNGKNMIGKKRERKVS